MVGKSGRQVRPNGDVFQTLAHCVMLSAQRGVDDSRAVGIETEQVHEVGKKPARHGRRTGFGERGPESLSGRMTLQPRQRVTHDGRVRHRGPVGISGLRAADTSQRLREVATPHGTRRLVQEPRRERYAGRSVGNAGAGPDDADSHRHHCAVAAQRQGAPVRDPAGDGAAEHGVCGLRGRQARERPKDKLGRAGPKPAPCVGIVQQRRRRGRIAALGCLNYKQRLRQGPPPRLRT